MFLSYVLLLVGGVVAMCAVGWFFHQHRRGWKSPARLRYDALAADRRSR